MDSKVRRLTILEFMRPYGASSIAATVLAAAALLTVACSSTTIPTSPSTDSPETRADPSPTPTPSTPAPATARYRVVFQSTWTATTHPVDFPSSAHFSPLIGGTHAAAVSFWRAGGLASIGIQDMAERGMTMRLSDEVNGAIGAGTAERVVSGGGLSTSPGTISAEFEISQSFPLISLVTMVAPSPDWFAGVSGLALFENGDWAQERRVELAPWDAGTDSGATFTSPDLASTPHQPIAPIVTAPLSPGGHVTPLGTFTFTRIGI